MGVYPAPRERAMKVQEVILRAMSGEFAWVQAAEILGLSARSMRRWRARYEEHGYNGLYDCRTRRPSPQRVPVATVERVLRLYRERYADFNVRHFHEVLQRDHGVGLSYSGVKKALQTAGLVGVGARMRAGLRASNRRARHLPMRYETGLPSSVIRFRTLHASTASRRCPDELRARRQSPTIDVYRKNAFSTRAC